MIFVPSPNPVREAAQARMIEDYEREAPLAGDPVPLAAQTREGPPDPYAYLATQLAPDRQRFEAAQDRMVADYDRDDSRPPDPFEWLNRQTPVAPVAEEERDRERDRRHDREWER